MNNLNFNGTQFNSVLQSLIAYIYTHETKPTTTHTKETKPTTSYINEIKVKTLDNVN